MSRLEKILGVSLALIIIGGVFVGFWVWQQRQLETRLATMGDLAVDTTAPSQTAGDESTLGRSILGFGLAHNEAREWREDAQLVMGLNSWGELQSPADISATRGDGWQYTFYSASSGEVATFGVNGREVSSGIRHTIENELTPRPASEWRLDDAEAINIFLANGGADFMEKEKSMYMTVQLSTVEDHSRMQWLVAVVAQETGHSFTMWIDAQTGEIMDTIKAQ